jgi:hypothetical protein
LEQDRRLRLSAFVKEKPVRPTLFACCTAALFLAAAAPPVGQPTKPSGAQKARIAALTQKLGDCHHAKAAPLAASKAGMETIVTRTLSACESQIQAIQAQLSKYIGANPAAQIIAAQRPVWRAKIRRIVADERRAR